MKSDRQTRILELISEQDIETQEALTQILKDEGFKVTQATISRDLRDLKLSKELSPTGTYRYVAASQRTVRAGNVKIHNAMADSIISVAYSMNNVVIKTYPGLAGAVATSFDSLHIETVLGCVAGDDTIIVITKSTDASADIAAKIKELMKSV